MVAQNIQDRIGNGETRELIYTTHGHELRGGDAGRLECREEGDKGVEKWDNCNSIINKIDLKNLNAISFWKVCPLNSLSQETTV